MMAEELPDLLKEARQRQGYGQAKLSAGDMRDLILHDTGNKQLAEQIEKYVQLAIGKNIKENVE